MSSLFPGNDAKVEDGTRFEKCDFSDGSPGCLEITGYKFSCGYSQCAAVTVAEGITNNHPSKVTPHIKKKRGDKGGSGNHFMTFVTMVKKTLSLRRGKLGAIGTEVLFVRFTEFLMVFETPNVIFVIKSLKIAYIMVLSKREKSGEVDKAVFTSFQKIKKKKQLCIETRKWYTKMLAFLSYPVSQFLKTLWSSWGDFCLLVLVVFCFVGLVLSTTFYQLSRKSNPSSRWHCLSYPVQTRVPPHALVRA